MGITVQPEYNKLPYITELKECINCKLNCDLPDKCYPPFKPINTCYTFRNIVISEGMLTLNIVPDDILEDPAIFFETGQINFDNITLKGLNHLYAYITGIFENKELKSQRKLVAKQLGISVLPKDTLLSRIMDHLDKY